jgi:hypothetical protein
MNEAELVRAGKELREHFPRFEGIRHVVAHVTEFASDPDHRIKRPLDEQGIHAPGGITGIFLGGNLSGRTYSVGYEGKLLSYDLSLDTLGHLIEVYQAAAAAFPQTQLPDAPPQTG